MASEDFGYIIKKERDSNSFFFKKPIKITILSISFLIFILITINAKFFSVNSQNKTIEVIKSPNYQIKVRNVVSDADIKNIDKTIYDNIVGGIDSNLKNNNDITIIQTSPTQRSKQILEKNIKYTGEDLVQDIKIEIDNNTKQDNKLRFSRVQLVALKSKKTAYEYWLGLNKSNPQIFSKKRYFIESVDLGKRGIFYRLQVGNFRSQVKAEEFCLKFIAITRKRKSDCIIVE